MRNIFLLISLLSFSFHGIGQDSVQNGKASFYHDSFHGLETSNGESYDKNDFTAAHRTLPFGTILMVTNKKNNKSVIVRVNDRGPFKKSRVIDLSYAAALKIGMIPFGVVQVRIVPMTYLDNSILNDALMADQEIRDCYGNNIDLHGTTMQLWKTDNMKHAFYMASSLSLEKKTDVVVRACGENEKRYYLLLVTGLDEKQFIRLRKLFSSEGFHVKKYENKE